jgi:hypothetical protein
MMKVDKIWNDLENDRSLHSGLLYKRYSGTIKPDVYVALKMPERLRCIAAHLSVSFTLTLNKIQKFRDIKLEILTDEKNPDKQFLLIVLLDQQHKDVFSTLCEDLVNKITDISNEDVLVKELFSRLEKWKLLFERIGRQGLSEEAQRGLFGELYFLRKFLNRSKDKDFCINSWRGTEKAVQDFQFADWAVEVKTTHGKNQQKIYISNERQLDISLVPHIFLIHLSLEIREGFGESLNQIVLDLINILSRSPAAFSLFNLKLLEAGYFDYHREYYENTGYSIRQENIYKVTTDFPKITESMIPPGVGDVRYSIVISANENWILNEETLYKNLLKD